MKVTVGRAGIQHGTSIVPLPCTICATCVSVAPALLLQTRRRPSATRIAILQCTASTQTTFKFRKGRPTDLSIIQQAVVAERMNPLFLDPGNFTVIVEEGGAVMGFGQLVTVGKEAKGQDLVELRTLVVLPQYRGRGVGSALTRQLMQESLGRTCLLMTVTSRTAFYNQLGFITVPVHDMTQLPWLMAIEWLAGNVVARAAVGKGVVVMKLEDGAAEAVASQE